MAINQNAGHKARHCVIIGATGAGKSQALKNLIPRRGVRLVAFDPDNDHGCIAYDSLGKFAKALKAADKSGKNYRISYTGAKNADQFEAFCAMAWEVLDGNKDTHIILEEAAQFTASSGPALESLGNLLLRGRKYGAIIYTIGQRAAELPTTVRNNSAHKYVGVVEGLDDAKSAAKLVDVKPEILMKTPPDELRFWWRQTGKSPEYTQFKYMG